MTASTLETVKTEAELRRELAAVYRLLAHFKMTDLIFTHVSVRIPGPEHHFLINPYGCCSKRSRRPTSSRSVSTVNLSSRPNIASTQRDSSFTAPSTRHAKTPTACCTPTRKLAVLLLRRKRVCFR